MHPDRQNAQDSEHYQQTGSHVHLTVVGNQRAGQNIIVCGGVNRS
jgi:hypothetical protein